MLCRQNFRQLVLGAIRILILVHQDVLETALVLIAYFPIFLQQQHRDHQQVIEVEGVVRAQLPGIDIVNLRNFLLEEGSRVPRHAFRPQ